MHSRKLNVELQRLTVLFDKTEAAAAGDLELQGHWGRYLCVLVAGFLENAISEIYVEFSQQNASQPVANALSERILRINNPKAQRFVETAAAFKSAWGRELEEFLEQDGRKDAIDSIMNNRHLITHGRNASISVARVQAYLQKSVEVIEFLEAQCGFLFTYG